MTAKWIWPTWAGGIGGVVATVAVSYLLGQGTGSMTRGLQLMEAGNLRAGTALLLLAGLLVGFLAVVPRLHPLLPGIPAVWFVVLYVPALFTGGPVAWYPTWMMNHFLVTASAGPLVATGVLVVATIVSLFGWDRRFQPEGSQEEAAEDRGS